MVVAILFWLFTKYKSPFFRYLFYLISFTGGLSVVLTIILHIHGTDPIENFESISTVVVTFLAPLVSYLWIHWGHGIVEKKVPKQLNIIIAAASAVLIGSFVFNVLRDDLENPVVLGIYSYLAAGYSVFVVVKNLKHIFPVEGRKFVTAFLVFSGINLVAGIIFMVLSFFFPDKDFWFFSQNVEAILGTLLNGVIIFFAWKYFLASGAVANKETEVPPSLVVFYKLTKREQELVLLLAQGASSKKVSDVLCVSHQTAKNYISRLYRKMDVSSKFELISLVQRESHLSF